MKVLLGTAVLVVGMSSISAFGTAKSALTTPQTGVLCDQYICADENGISIELTKKYLGDAAAEKLKSQGEFDMRQFTLATGVFCDAEEKACHIDRYFDADGKRSAIDAHATAVLFGGQ